MVPHFIPILIPLPFPSPPHPPPHPLSPPSPFFSSVSPFASFLLSPPSPPPTHGRHGFTVALVIAFVRARAAIRMQRRLQVCSCVCVRVRVYMCMCVCAYVWVAVQTDLGRIKKAKKAIETKKLKSKQKWDLRKEGKKKKK
eukprot:GHVU01004505.1.p1 GENE.GHVU01004505.1~~GHVU01004505.1.p1  ORF type:complete len:141 (-),score=15.46 GHVU01004505.1:387-809(-)